MRRAANPTRKISITIPGHLFQALERTLSYSQSRSAFISNAIEDKLKHFEGVDMTDIPTNELLDALALRFRKDSNEDVLVQSLLQILSK